MTFMMKVFRFGVVGVCTAVLYYGLLYAFVELLGMNATLSSSVVYLIVIVFNYLMHYSWTFTVSAAHNTALKRYLFMTACGFLINGLIMYAGVSHLGMNYFLVQTASMALIILWNFTVSMLWVFRD